jgi:hypothetical protein
MCLLAVLTRRTSDAPLMIGANREEFYDRGGEAPRILDGPVRAIAGIDPRAHGTWLGINKLGVLIAVTNRKKERLPPAPRSRGTLARELLGHHAAHASAEHALQELRTERYAGCNYLCADIRSAFVVHGGDRIELVELTPGIHALTATDVDDRRDARLNYALDWLERQSFSTTMSAMEGLRLLCGQNLPDRPAMVLRGERAGTVSSTLYAVRERLADSVAFHAQGPPDMTPYVDVSELFSRLANG